MLGSSLIILYVCLEPDFMWDSIPLYLFVDKFLGSFLRWQKDIHPANIMQVIPITILPLGNNAISLFSGSIRNVQKEPLHLGSWQKVQKSPGKEHMFHICWRVSSFFHVEQEDLRAMKDQRTWNLGQELREIHFKLANVKIHLRGQGLNFLRFECQVWNLGLSCWEHQKHFGCI